MECPKRIIVIERTEAEFVKESENFVIYSHRDEGMSRQWGFNKDCLPKMIEKKQIEVIQ